MRISHEAIYQSLFIEGRGGLERELVACLRTGRAVRNPRTRARKQRIGFITNEVTIGARPEEVESRKTLGHWGGDLTIRSEPVRDRHAGRAHQQIHDTATSAAPERLWDSGDDEARARRCPDMVRCPFVMLWPRR